jgi:hypothetical protein
MKTDARAQGAGRSEVAALMHQIDLEYEAVTRGLLGLAEGVARHAWITARMELLASLHEQLEGAVGTEEATRLVLERTLQQSAAAPRQEEHDGQHRAD